MKVENILKELVKEVSPGHLVAGFLSAFKMNKSA